MNEDLNWHYRRWRTADDEGRDDDADAAFKLLFDRVVPAEVVPPGFTVRTMEAVAVAAAEDTRRAKRTRRVFVGGGAAALAATVYYGAGVAVAALTMVIDLLVTAIVESSTRLNAGAGVWGLIVSLGRATAAFIAEPEVTFVIIAIHGVAIAALYAMHRLLGSDGESLQ